MVEWIYRRGLPPRDEQKRSTFHGRAFLLFFELSDGLPDPLRPADFFFLTVIIQDFQSITVKSDCDLCRFRIIRRPAHLFGLHFVTSFCIP